MIFKFTSKNLQYRQFETRFTESHPHMRTGHLLNISSAMDVANKQVTKKKFA